jgi:hypothetical protein
MINGGLETFQLLLLEKNGSNRVAASVMDNKIASLSKSIRVLQLVKALELTTQTIFPVTDEKSSNLKLVGTVLRKDLFSYLKKVFNHEGMEEVIVLMLPIDSKEHDERVARKEKKATLKIRQDRILENVTSSIERTVGHVTQSLERTEQFIFDSSGDHSKIQIPITTPAIDRTESIVHLEDDEINISVNPMHNDSNSNSGKPTLDQTETSATSEVKKLRNDKKGIDFFNTLKGKISVGAGPKTEVLGTVNPNPNLNLNPNPNSNPKPNPNPKTEVLGTVDTTNKSSASSIAREKDITASIVWSAVSIAAHSFLKDAMGVLQYQNAPEAVGKEEIETDKSNHLQQPRLLALFAKEVHVEAEAALHLNLFPFRYTNIDLILISPLSY